MTNRPWRIGCGVGIAILALAASAPASLTINPTPFYTHEQNDELFSIRGLALARNLSGDVYYGHIQPAADGVLSPGDRHIVLLHGGTVQQSVAFSGQPKALETDSRGNVYAGGYQNGQAGVYIFSSDLTQVPTFLPVSQADEIDGLAANTVGNSTFLYVSNRNDSNAFRSFVRQYDVTNVAAPTATGWQKTLPTTGLRGIAVDPATGEVWATARTTFITYDTVNPNLVASITPGGSVFKITADASDFSSASEPNAVDVAVSPITGKAYVVTQSGLQDKNGKLVVNGSTSQILEMNSGLGITQSFNLNVVSPSSDYGLGQIDVNASGLFYVTDEDSSISGSSPTVYVDRIFTAHLPEPASAMLLGMGGVMLLARRRRSADAAAGE